VNWAYTKEHDAVAALPPLTARKPFRSLALLLGSSGWRVGFASETAGWVVYVIALAIAPLSLVQAVSASGIAVLALLVVHGQPSRLSIRERLAVGSRCSDWFCSHCRWSGQSPPHTHRTVPAS